MLAAHYAVATHATIVQQKLVKKLSTRAATPRTQLIWTSRRKRHTLSNRTIRWVERETKLFAKTR